MGLGFRVQGLGSSCLRGVWSELPNLKEARTWTWAFRSGLKGLGLQGSRYLQWKLKLCPSLSNLDTSNKASLDAHGRTHPEFLHHAPACFGCCTPIPQKQPALPLNGRNLFAFTPCKAIRPAFGSSPRRGRKGLSCSEPSVSTA